MCTQIHCTAGQFPHLCSEYVGGVPKAPLAPILHVLEEEAARMSSHIALPPTTPEDGLMFSLSHVLPQSEHSDTCFKAPWNETERWRNT